MAGSPGSVLRYGGAAAVIALATAVRWQLDGLLSDGLPYITYFAAVAAAK